MDCKIVQLLYKTFGQLLKNLNTELLYDAALLGIYPKEMITYGQRLVAEFRNSLIHNSPKSGNN